MAEVGSQIVPQGALGTQLLPDGLKQRATNLLGLVHEKGEHHQHGKDHGEILLPVAEVVFVMVALILQGVERFVFDLPSVPARLVQTTRRCGA